MKLYYTMPEVEIRKYKLTSDYVTTSDPSENDTNDLNRDDEVDYFG